MNTEYRTRNTEHPPCPRSGGFRLLLAAFVFFAVAQIVWLALDQRPVVEERHYFAACRVAHALRGTEIGRAYPHTGYRSPYPPLLAWYTGAILAVTGCSADVAVLTLLPFAWLLLWAVWKTGRLFFADETAAAGAVLVLCFHHFVDIEPRCEPYTFINEYMLDLPLSALLATALYFLLRHLRAPSAHPASHVPGSASRVPRSLFLGLAIGLALLIKVSVPLYLAIMAVGLLLEGYRSKTAWLSLWRPAAIAAAVALPWYSLHVGDVAGYLMEHEFNAALALRDGMPALNGMENVAYYLVALRSMLSTPLAVAALLSAAIVVVARGPGRRLIVTGMVLSYLALTLLWGKSWRFLTPCLIYFGVAMAGAADALGRREGIRRTIAYGLAAAALLRMAAMYGALCPFTVEQGHVVRLAPVGDDGGIGRIMADILRERDPDLLSRISVSPCLRRFRHAAFMQYALEHDLPLAEESEWRLRGDEWREELERSEFIVTKTGDNGPARFVPHRTEIETWLRAKLGKTVRLVGEYPLPDGTAARLYKQERTFRTWRRLPAAAPEPALVNFDDTILLTGCRVEREGMRLLVHCAWQAWSAPARDYRLFFHLRDGYRNVSVETFTPGDGLLPVTGWKPGARLEETYAIPWPAAFADGECALWLGWNRRARRLPVRSSVYPRLMNAARIPFSPPHRRTKRELSPRARPPENRRPTARPAACAGDRGIP